MVIFSRLPEWICFIATLVLLQFSHEVGFKIGTIRRLKPGENPETAAGALSGITIGLLAFMLAFTFNGASNNHDLRKDLFVQEANTVRAMYQSSLQMPEPYQIKVRNLLQEYLDLRIKMSGANTANLKQSVERLKKLQGELWSINLELQKKETSTPMSGLFMESLNKLFDLNTERVSAVTQGRIPSIIWTVLYLLTIITIVMVGYRIGLHGIRSTFMELCLIVSFSLILSLIIVLDRPNGVMRPNTRPLSAILNMVSTGAAYRTSSGETASAQN